MTPCRTFRLRQGSGGPAVALAEAGDCETVARQVGAAEATPGAGDHRRCDEGAALKKPDIVRKADTLVATKMGGPGAPDDFGKGYLTQMWLAVSDDPAATVSGRYWHHRQPRTPAKEACDHRFQDQLVAKLAELTGVPLF